MILQTQARPIPSPAISSAPGTRRILQRKCACGGTPGPSGECAECKRKRLQSKLAVNQPGDQYEQEADRVAEVVVSGNRWSRPSISTLGSYGAVQREEPSTLNAEYKPKTEEEKYKEAAKKVGEAFLKTPPGKEIEKKAEELGDAFISTLPGKVITGAAVVGAVATLAATHRELPIGIPEIPLDKIKPGLKMKITYEGPVDKPSKVMVGFSFQFGGGKASGKKSGRSESEKRQAETAKRAAEDAKFREGLRSDEDKAADAKRLNDRLGSRMLRSDQLTPRTSPLSFGVAGEELGFHPGVPSAGTRTSSGSWAPDFKLTGETWAEGRKKKEEEPLQRKSADHSEVSDAPPIVDEVLQSTGQPLDSATRAFMEERFGYEFGRVRIHSDERAGESARAVRAHAYTVGHHLVFDSGRFAPKTQAGQRLLAHELAHVVQQSSGAGPSLQRQDKPPAERIDVSLVFSDDNLSMSEGRSYATTALRVTSCANAKQQLQALGKPIGTIYIVSHSNSSGEIQIDSQGGKIMVKLADCSKELKGLAENIAPTDVDFRGCKLGEAPEQMETFRQNVGAQTARAGNCWSIAQPMGPLTHDGLPLTDESQIPEGQKAEIDAALKAKINSMKSEDGHSVKDCIVGLARGETADNNFVKLRKRYFQHKGNLTAGWASPELNHEWQKGSICVKDMTDKTKPCNIVTTKAASATSPPPAKKQSTVETP